jgi:DNA-binding NarL/FixJ family response regulator
VRLIRVLLAVPLAISHAFGQILAGTDDIEIVGTATEGIEILLTTGASRADVVVIVMEGDTVPGICTHLLAEYPHVKVLGVTGDIRRAVLYELQPRLVPLGEMSPSGLPDAIRTAVRSEVPE